MAPMLRPEPIPVEVTAPDDDEADEDEVDEVDELGVVAVEVVGVDVLLEIAELMCACSVSCGGLSARRLQT